MATKTSYVPATAPGSAPPFPDAVTGFAMLMLRVAVGVIMTVHGFQKLSDIPAWQAQVENLGMPLPSLFALFAIAGEFLGGLGLIFGLLTRIAAFGVFCSMATAIVLVHLPHGLLAKDNGFEYPLTLLCAAFFFIAAGAGPVSLDAWFGRFLHRPERRAAAVQPAPVRIVSRPPAERALDPVDEAGEESFPASDPPARSAHSVRDHVRER